MADEEFRAVLPEPQRGEEIVARPGRVFLPAVGRVPQECPGQLAGFSQVRQERAKALVFHPPIAVGRGHCLPRQRDDRLELRAQFRRNRVGFPVAEQSPLNPFNAANASRYRSAAFRGGWLVTAAAATGGGSGVGIGAGAGRRSMARPGRWSGWASG